MDTKMKLPCLLLALLLSGCSIDPVIAADIGNASAKTPQLQQSYTWYDGKRARQVWLDPELLAEFNPGKKAEQDAMPVVKSVYPEAAPVGNVKGGVQMWRMGAGVSSDKAARALVSAAATGVTDATAATTISGTYSPVLRDGASTSARMRALPGNIIVYLNPSWDAAGVNAWANRRQLTILKKLEIGSNVYVIKTAPGLEALNTANALYQSGEVVAAFPDWWQEVSVK